MQGTNYKVTCKKCGGNDILTVTDDRTVFYKNHFPIISARFRPDLKWGFECGACQNDSRLAIQEKGQLDILVKGSPDVIKTLADNLKAKNELKFSMEQI